MATIELSGNPNLRDALDAAEARGCTVEHRNRTGEKVVRHPTWQRPIVLNSRRKDTPRILVVALRRLAA